MRFNPTIKRFGDRAFLLEFPPRISEETLQHLLMVKKLLRENIVKEEIEISSAYHSLLINYPYPIDDVYGEVKRLKAILQPTQEITWLDRKLYHIPVVYGGPHGPDLEYIAEKKNLSVEQVISLHSSVVYTVYFTGFLPGFLYLGGLPTSLHLPRKKQPRKKVPKGAVGIGGQQTGIYPQDSPGGWQIIGNSPVPLFDPHRQPPCDISAGDKLKFERVSEDQYHILLKKVKQSVYRIKWERYDG